MKLHRQISLIGLALLFIVAACEEVVEVNQDALKTNPSEEKSSLKMLYEEVDSVSSYQLIAGRHIDAGEVQVWNDENVLYVKYKTDGWCIMETHLHVAANMEDIPQTKKGNPKPGKFMYKGQHDCKMEVTYKIDLNKMGWECGKELYLAAHAVVKKKYDENQTETAWGKGERFTERGNWAMYFKYKITCEDDDDVDSTGALSYVAFLTDCDTIYEPLNGEIYSSNGFDYMVETNYKQSKGNIKFDSMGDQLGEDGEVEYATFIFKTSCKNVEIQVETKNESLDTKSIRIGHLVVMDNGFIIKWDKENYNETEETYEYVFKIKSDDI
jgi:hypothetical protein